MNLVEFNCTNWLYEGEAYFNNKLVEGKRVYFKEQGILRINGDPLISNKEPGEYNFLVLKNETLEIGITLYNVYEIESELELIINKAKYINDCNKFKAS